MKTRKISRTSERAVRDLEEAAKSHGWAEDQGTGARVRNAAEEFERAGRALRRRIARLERAAAKDPECPHEHCRYCEEDGAE